jgi:hypothetical protein
MNLIKPTPWDSSVFSIPTWEITEYSEVALNESVKVLGHHTIKVDPLSDKKMLHDFGFYYCDTLIEPYCRSAKLKIFKHQKATIAKISNFESILPVCHGAFDYGRFNRDFNLNKADACSRYDKWLLQLLNSHEVYGLLWEENLAGFIACSENNLILHALDKSYRGKRLSKYWWSEICINIFEIGHQEVISSISAANLAVVNLYASLGFSFRKSKDVYHFYNI